MADQVYRDLMNRFARQGGMYRGKDIPEFYEMAQELFTVEEAAVATAMPKGISTADQIAATLGRSKDQVEAVLQTMAGKGLCLSMGAAGSAAYALPPLVPGIFEFQFMRGTRTEKDRKLAKLIHRYKEAFDATEGVRAISFPPTRVITVEERVEVGNTVHTYDQMSAYVEAADPIAVSTCYCRHEAELLNESDTCGKPNEVCMQFGMGAQFVIDKELGRRISKKEAMEILKRSEEAGLVHCSVNRQNIDFVCNCCADHCVILKTALAQPKPGLALNSGFQPVIDPDQCTACAECVERCPSKALTMAEEDIPGLDLDRCFGCSVCATVCPTEGIAMVAKPGYPAPPLDQLALREALKSAARA